MDKKYSNLSPAKKALLEKWKGGKFQADTIPKRPVSQTIPLSFSSKDYGLLTNFIMGVLSIIFLLLFISKDS
jgi:hypothetical protein